MAVGGSLGGTRAVEALLSGLPEEFPAPVAVVLHRSHESGDRLRPILQRKSRLPVREPQDKEPIRPGHVYLAPPGYHLLVDGEAFALSTEGPVCHARPSIDVFFETVADAYGPRAAAVVLTGASADGARGAARIKQHGGWLAVQDPATAESRLMPAAALAAAPADAVLPVEALAEALVRLCARAPEAAVR